MRRSKANTASQVGNNVTCSSPSQISHSGSSVSDSSTAVKNSNLSTVSSQANSQFYIKRVQKKIKEGGKVISSSTGSSCGSKIYGATSTLTGFPGSCISQQSSSGRRPAGLNMSENNSTPGSGSRCSKKDNCGSAGIYITKGRPVRPKAAPKAAAAATAAALGGKSPAGVVNLMSTCADAAAKQAERLRAGKRAGDCLRDNPYASLGTETFRRLLSRTGGGRRRRKGLGGGSGRKRPKIKWCKPKVDECEAMQTQLCPNLGAGHTHGKLLEEVTPLLLRTTQSLHCQLRELCRRLFFMRHNVPQLTAPALVNFHAILAEITRMLLADFASFPTGLKLPDRGVNAA